jgi:hypothetical protein
MHPVERLTGLLCETRDGGNDGIFARNPLRNIPGIGDEKFGK